MKKNSSKNTYRKNYVQIIKKDFKLNKSLYILFIPVLLYYIIFHYGSLYGAIIAFKNFSPAKGIIGSPWVGFDHFERFFNFPSFGKIIWNTLNISITSLVFAFPAPIILALLMNELRSTRFAKIAQNATYLPHFISLVVICGLIKDFTKDTGVVTYLLAVNKISKQISETSLW